MASRGRSSRAKLAVAALGLLLGAVAGAGFELGDVLSSPFPSELTASPAGERVAWVFNREGRRSVWIASAPEWEGKEAFPATAEDAAKAEDVATADDGQEITSLTWSADGELLAFVRGGPPNTAGELPNPLSVVTGVERSVWLLEIETGRSRRVDSGSSPLFLADRSRIVYLKEGAVWSAGLGGQPEPPSRLVAARGGFGQLELSPDGSRLAFTSRRGNHSFIGVYSFGEAELAWVDPALDLDSAPSWSPDGTRLAFVRQPPRFDTILFEPLRAAAVPWSIRIAERRDDGSWVGVEAWRADPGAGSVFRGVVASRQLYWMEDGGLVFPWEKNGWVNLWRLDPSGGGVSAATPGEHEVEFVAQARPGTGLLLSSNASDIDRRHVWRLDGGAAPLQVTAGEGIEQAPVPLAGGGFAVLAASGREPLHPEIVRGDVRRDLAQDARPARFPLQQMVAPREVRFAATDGVEIHGQLFVPPDVGTGNEGGRRPAVAYFHGGSRRQMLLGWHYSSYYHHCYAMHQYLVSRGYVVLSVNYRSGIGYGLDFREAYDYGATGASELRDVLAAGRFLAGLDFVDPDRVGLWGGSYGGYLTALGLSRASDLFAAGVDIHGVHDWNRTIRNFIPSYDPLADPEVARLAFASSPLSSVDTWRSPVLLIHGDDDRNVPFDESVELSVALRSRGVEVETLVFPDEVHGFLTHRHWLEVLGATAEFFERRLATSARR